MKTYNIHEAKTHLSRLIEAAAAGEEIIIARAGKPVARLVRAGTGGGRRLGLLKGKIREAADCWEPDPEIESLFYGELSAGKRVAERRSR